MNTRSNWLKESQQAPANVANRRLKHLILSLALLVLWPIAQAHEVRPAHLLINESEPNTYFITWKVPGLAGARLPVDPTFDSRCNLIGDSVARYDTAASVRTWTQHCQNGLAGTQISFSRLNFTVVDVLVQGNFLDGRAFTTLVRPSEPTYTVPARVGHSTLFKSYFLLGIEHILQGFDHLLFVLALTLLLRSWRRLAWAISGFTLAHSVTLALAALDILNIPVPPVEAVIALSIVLLAVELHDPQQHSLVQRRPWLVAVAFGLVHGLGFASALSEYGLPVHAHLPSLFAFNLGVEAGQLAFVAALLACLFLLQRIPLGAQTLAARASSYGIGVCGAYWLIERVAGFS